MPNAKRQFRRKMRKPSRKGRKVNRRNYRPSNSWNSKAVQKINSFGSTRAITGFPERMTVTLPYVISGRVNPGVVAYTDQVININNTYDPDNSGAGHQPRGFDQWMTVYNKYRVSRLDVNILVRQRASHGLNVRALANNQSASLGSDFNLAEFTNHIYIGQTASNTPPLQRRLTFYPHKILGLPWQQYISAEETAGTATTSPSDSCFLHVVAQAVDQTTVLDIEWEIQLMYRVTLFDRQNLAIS